MSVALCCIAVSTVWLVLHPVPAGACTVGDQLCQEGQTWYGNVVWGLELSALLLLTDVRWLLGWLLVTTVLWLLGRWLQRRREWSG
jgi:hypothetical protein